MGLVAASLNLQSTIEGLLSLKGCYKGRTTSDGHNKAKDHSSLHPPFSWL
ncbi:hypothetical protein PtA15_14A332 [Puccinia triticina]|uniref:Uncharacterized protein n=1 Tax=Puccinia triticina TaxID=208348 RepID=A0ABY7D1I6_9BASI|nr:uncharacterized protein PtA15_14A332 [Puccinia triticina]WAQ91448.1 hypothetical protein PtA15_14A332 [Puccinia triticina]